jgi:hypothetical protein
MTQSAPYTRDQIGLPLTFLVWPHRLVLHQTDASLRTIRLVMAVLAFVNGLARASIDSALLVTAAETATAVATE